MMTAQVRISTDMGLPNGTVLDAIECYIRDELKKHLGAFLDRAEQTLDETRRQSSNPADWSAGREAVNWLAQHKQSILDTMYVRMVKGLADSRPFATTDLSDLRLMDYEELAVTLARAKMVSRVMDRAKATVHELEARLTTLVAARIRVNPKALGPGHLADCFQAILQEQAVPVKAQTVLIGAFGDRSTDQIIDFYVGLNRLLHEKGVEPTFPMARKSFLSSHQVTPNQLAHTLRDKLARLQAAIDTLPKTTGQSAKPGDRLEQQLTRTQAETGSSALSMAQIRQLDHLEAFFLEILRDTRISDRIRSELSRLTLPLMAACLPSPEQFNNPDNPVRVFVRQLALLGYRDQEQPLQDFELIQALIGRIVAEGGQVLDSFHGGAEALYTLAKRQIKRIKAQRSGQAELQNPENEQATARLSVAEEARKQVMVEIREHAAGMTLPTPVQEFILRLLGPWMMVRYQRYGEGSQPWAEARAFAALFFDALRLAVDEKEQVRKRALRRQTLVQARVRTERSRAPFDRANELLAWLENHFAKLDQRLYSPIREATYPDVSTNRTFLEAMPTLGL